MKQERARDIGQMALIWIASQPEILDAFVTGSGLAREDVRARAEEPEFLGFVLDFVLASDAAVLAFADTSGLAPDEPARARHLLGGGEPHWT